MVLLNEVSDAAVLFLNMPLSLGGALGVGLGIGLTSGVVSRALVNEPSDAKVLFLNVPLILGGALGVGLGIGLTSGVLFRVLVFLNSLLPLTVNLFWFLGALFPSSLTFGEECLSNDPKLLGLGFGLTMASSSVEGNRGSSSGREVFLGADTSPTPVAAASRRGSSNKALTPDSTGKIELTSDSMGTPEASTADTSAALIVAEVDPDDEEATEPTVVSSGRGVEKASGNGVEKVVVSKGCGVGFKGVAASTSSRVVLFKKRSLAAAVEPILETISSALS